ncbi:MAG: hypothetical protein LBV67_09325 [Streptococcaceae bacterium]|jgi:hypothetical protein|nr:hypothetical protein [Streptococcaceae bacterium]
MKKGKLFIFITLIALTTLSWLEFVNMVDKTLAQATEVSSGITQIRKNQTYNDTFLINDNNELIIMQDNRYHFTDEKKGTIAFSIEPVEQKGDVWFKTGSAKVIYLVFDNEKDAQNNRYNPVYSNLQPTTISFDAYPMLEKVDGKYHRFNSKHEDKGGITDVAKKELPSSFEAFLKEFKPANCN